MNRLPGYRKNLERVFALTPPAPDDGRRAALQSGESKMLWYDADKGRSLEEKVLRAAEYFKGKYGVDATVCLINPSIAAQAPAEINSIALRPVHTVLPDHFWIGSEARETQEK